MTVRFFVRIRFSFVFSTRTITVRFFVLVRFSYVFVTRKISVRFKYAFDFRTF